MAALLLLLVLVAFPAIDVLPHQVATIRLAGLSILWWYGGVVAPVLAAAHRDCVAARSFAAVALQMKVAVQVLGVWLTPVLWLSMPTMVVERGPDGLWIGLVLVVVPLLALGLGPPERTEVEPESIFPVAVLLFTVGILFWANLILAGDVAAWLGFATLARDRPRRGRRVSRDRVAPRRAAGARSAAGRCGHGACATD